MVIFHRDELLQSSGQLSHRRSERNNIKMSSLGYTLPKDYIVASLYLHAVALYQHEFNMHVFN